MAHEREYIERHLGEPLTLALTDICLKRPRDPILYLSQWLLQWQRNKDQLLVRRRELEELLFERQKLAELLLVTETEAELKTEDEKGVDEKVNDDVIESEDNSIEPKRSTEGQTRETREWSLDLNMIRNHVPVEIPEIEPIIDNKLHPVSSPIFELDEENADDRLQEKAPRKGSSLRKDSERHTSVKPASDKRTSVRLDN